MEFSGNVLSALPNIISVITAEDLVYVRGKTSKQESLCMIIDSMGEASSKAQYLKNIITTMEKFQSSSHKLYLMKDQENKTVVGILKVGIKKLFIVDRKGRQHEIEPLCVLDFYVHESCQRSGYGKQMFEYMLKNEQVINPCKLAFDRPSDKFRSFLKKHYNLENFVQQPNNFVVFDEYGLPDNPNLHLLNKAHTRRHSTEIKLSSERSGTYHRHTRSLTPNHHYYTSPLFNNSSPALSSSSIPLENNYTSVSSINHSAPPKEIYVQRKRELISQQEHGKQSLYGKNPISWE
ncbi:6611_t:CDS:2 [Funneliformis mosseae]|uniref:Alpha-tubulin N-acetyltransferase n=1 Tax=Funneliformis mosseae TaxID=27381 RepID=A0A9N9GDG1_FUNMO|nr:6611_t:CDS:2 [Funneliformis mosseae]